MSDNSTLALQRGNCPAPFLDNAFFPATGGRTSLGYFWASLILQMSPAAYARPSAR
jgi:hypothetical protein